MRQQPLAAWPDVLQPPPPGSACACAFLHHSIFFMPHVLSNLGKKQEKGREPYIMIVELMVDFKFLGGGIMD